MLNLTPFKQAIHTLITDKKSKKLETCGVKNSLEFGEFPFSNKEVLLKNKHSG